MTRASDCLSSVPVKSALLFSLCFPALALSAASDYPVQPVPFTDVRITGGVLQARQATNAAVTMPFALGQCDSSLRLKNFDLAAETMRRRAAGERTFQNRPPTQYPFDDSDVFKALEGAAFCLSVQPDPELAARLQEVIRRVAAAQEPDGYLYTWRTMHPDQPAHDWIHAERWLKDPHLSHELYNIGHLYEAGIAHFQATGSRSLLDVCLKSAELVHRDFGDGEPRIAPGHQVIEMGLAKLYRQTGDRRWIDLAKFFIDVRGHGGNAYSQDHKPVVEQSEAVGHAVRANYLYSGMADVAALTGDERYLAAIKRIWENVVSRKLHLTGGCGARASGEAYGDDYELPHRCYNETCAAVAFLFWNHRMFLLTGDAKYMDVFERSLYNGVLSGVSLSGDRFFYPNPLEYDGKTANNHGHAGRAPWFGCACCPPNILRTIASLGGYVCAVQGERLFINLYAQGEATATVAGMKVKCDQTTRYPWDGTVTLRVTPERPGRFSLCLRIPGWAQGRPLPSDLYSYDDPASDWSVQINGQPVAVQPERGYAVLTREWKSGDTVALQMPMSVRRVAGHPKIAATRGQVALERGPIVYAFEALDNDGSVFDAVLPAAAQVVPEHRDQLLGGVTVLRVAQAAKVSRDDSGGLVTRPAALTAIPYAFWANRGLSPMTVWLAREPAQARPAPRPTAASKAKVSTSYHRGGMDPAHINDQIKPEDFADGSAPNFDFWPRKGTTEWITYDFDAPTQVRAVRVWWFDDTGRGECRLPASWSIRYRAADGEWQPVAGASEYLSRKGGPVKVSFHPVKTDALRLEVQLPSRFSAGVYEWEVE